METSRRRPKSSPKKFRSPQSETVLSFRKTASRRLAVLLGAVLYLAPDGILENEHNTLSSFATGDWTFDFSPGMDTRERTEIQRLFQQAYPRIREIMGEESTHQTGDWTIAGTDNSYAVTSMDSRRIEYPDRMSAALKIHEFIHIFQGVDFPEANWIREGLAVALSNIVASEMDIPRWDDAWRNVATGTNLGDHLGTAPLIPYEQNPFFLTVRYYFAGKFWEEVLREDPSSIKRLTASLREFYEKASLRYRHKDQAEAEIASLSPDEFFKTFLGKVPSAIDEYESLFSPYDARNITGKMLYAYFCIDAGKPRINISGIQRGSDGRETGIHTVPVTGTFRNEETSLEYTLQFGVKENGGTIDLSMIPGKIGGASRYEAVFEAEGFRSEQVRFSL